MVLRDIPTQIGNPHRQRTAIDLATHQEWHAQFYRLIGVCVMPDHVHTILSPNDKRTISDVMKGIKGVSSLEINRLRGRHGALWQGESWDRVLRDEEELQEKLNYMLMNPVEAGLAEDPSSYRGWHLQSLGGQAFLSKIYRLGRTDRSPKVPSEAEGWINRPRRFCVGTNIVVTNRGPKSGPQFVTTGQAGMPVLLVLRKSAYIPGSIIFSGRTTSSNFLPVRTPSMIAASRRVMFSVWVFLATFQCTSGVPAWRVRILLPSPPAYRDATRYANPLPSRPKTQSTTCSDSIRDSRLRTPSCAH